VKYPKQERQCEPCEGYKRVATITTGPMLFESVLRKPLPLTFAKAKKVLSEYKGNDAGALTMLVRQLARNLNTMPCPWCNATGIAYVLQQLTPEEAAALKVKDEA